MDSSSRVAAVIAYIPVVGWLYVLLFQRHNVFAVFHARQSIGLFVFLLAMFVGWAVITWVLGWIPFAFVIGNALFALVIAAYVFGVFAWIAGILNAARGRVALLPIFGKTANAVRL
jgi:uncharacterized membrane protein